MMPECFCCLAAKGVVRDVATNTISVFSILEQLGAAGFPFFIQEMAVLALWRRLEGEPQAFDLELIVRNNETQLHRAPVRVDFGTGRGHRTIINIQGLLVKEPGELTFLLLDATATYGSYVVTIPPPEPASRQEPQA
jgi:hypothetical protein